jgi:hypothetical protein
MTRNGKIARLPRHLREQLNRRLDDGEPGPQALAWLNECPAAKEVFERDFDGRPVNEQNLSEWRQGGFREWQRQQEACDHVRRLADQSEALDEATEETNVSTRLAIVFAVELFKVMERLLEKGGDDEAKLGYLREALREIRLLRRGDHSATRLQMEMERWERQCEREHEENLEQMKEKSKRRLRGLIFSTLHEKNMAELFGGGEQGRKVAAMLTKIKFDQPLDDLDVPGEATPAGNGAPETGRKVASHEKAETAPAAAAAAATFPEVKPTQSNQIKPNQTKSNQMTARTPESFGVEDACCQATRAGKFTSFQARHSFVSITP